MLYEIYLITNLINNKKYIGQTKKGRAEHRWKEHSVFYVNDNKILHNAIKKYGVESFTFEIIKTDIAENLIDEQEKYYIKYYNTFYLHGHGYNMTEGGQGIHGYKHSDEVKQQIKESNLTAWQKIKEKEPERHKQLCVNRSLANKGKPKSEAHKAILSKLASKRTGEKNSFFGKHFTEESKEKLRETKAKNFSPINAYDLKTGKLWKTFRFATEAVQELNLQKSANTRILLVCKAQKGHAYGYIWRYSTDFNAEQLTNEILMLENKNPRARTIVQYDLNNNYVNEFESAAAASRMLQPDKTKQRVYAKAINEACLGKKKTAYKFIWKYKD